MMIICDLGIDFLNVKKIFECFGKVEVLDEKL